MVLTGKCKQDFEEWYKINNYPNNLPPELHFDYLQLSMQWGVYQDFFDSVGIIVGVNRYAQATDVDFIWYVMSGLIDVSREFSETRQEARKAAIEKANEIYNS